MTKTNILNEKNVSKSNNPPSETKEVQQYKKELQNRFYSNQQIKKLFNNNENRIKSIAKKGILSSAKLLETTDNINTSADKIIKIVCTNLIELSNLNNKEIKAVFDNVIKHNLTGANNISLERSAIKKITSDYEFIFNIEERIQQSVLFILKPITDKNVFKKDLYDDSNISTNSQILEDKIKGFSEIRTEKSIDAKDIIGVITPKIHEKIVKKHFPNIPVITAKPAKGYLNLGGNMDMCFKVKKKFIELKVEIPDYRMALRELYEKHLKQNNITSFMTHLTRLDGSFELEKHNKNNFYNTHDGYYLLFKCQNNKVDCELDRINSYTLLNQNIVTNCLKKNKIKFEIHPTDKKYIIAQLRESQLKLKKFNGLREELSLKRGLVKKLSDEQIKYLRTNNFTVEYGENSNGPGFIITYLNSDKFKSDIRKVLRNWDKTTTIQAVARGYLTRNNYQYQINEKVTVLQACFRGSLVRNKLNDKKLKTIKILEEKLDSNKKNLLKQITDLLDKNDFKTIKKLFSKPSFLIEEKNIALKIETLQESLGSTSLGNNTNNSKKGSSFKQITLS